MEKKTVITEEKRIKLTGLIKSGGENKKMAISIVNECNIPVSFVQLLCLAMHTYDNTFVFNTPLVNSQNFHKYIIKLAAGNFELPSMVDLDLTINMWRTHCVMNGLKQTPHELKYLTKEYHREGQNFTVKPFIKLNPKKNVRRK
jgi:hypothetical protein